MLPNRFPDAGEAPEYNTVDATLWYFVGGRRVPACDWRPPVARRALSGVAVDRALAPARHALRYSRRLERRPAARRRSRRAAHLDGCEDRRLGRHAAHRQAGRDQCAVVQRALRSCATSRADARRTPMAAREYASAAERVARSFDARFWFDAGSYLYDVDRYTGGR